MTVLRTTVPDFALGNPILAGATVALYEVDDNGAITTTLATIYEGPIGTDLLPNPFQLDGYGKNVAPLYLEVPCIASIESARTPTFETGIIQVRGVWKGDWVTATRYNSGDIVADPDSDNTIYVAAADYVSGATLAADVAAGNLVLLLTFTFGGLTAATTILGADYLPFEKTSDSSDKKITVTNFLASALRLVANGSAAAPSIAAAADTDTGIAWDIGGANTASLVGNGSEVVRWTGSSLGVNYTAISAADTAGAPQLLATGSDTNVAWDIQTHGSGAIDFKPGGVRQVQISYTASAVNYSLLTGSATGSSLGIVATGTDSNIAFIVNAKGTGYAYLAGSSLPILRAASVASAVNYFDLANSATGNALTLTAAGTDSNIGITYATKGSGVHVFTGHLTLEGVTSTGATGTGALVFATAPTVTTLTVSSGSLTVTGGTITTGAATDLSLATSGGTQLAALHTASAVNYAIATGGATGAPVQFSGQGTDSTIQTNIYAKGAANVTFLTNRQSGAVTQANILHVASAVNYAELAGAATAGNTGVSAKGSDSNPGIVVNAKGTGVIYLAANALPIWKGQGVASSVNYLLATPVITGSGPSLATTGSDTNAALNLASLGTGAVSFKTNATVEQFRVQHSATAVNYLTVTGAATGSTVQFSAGNSSDSSASIDYFVKGSTGAHVFKTNSATRQFQVSNTGSAVNYWNMAGHTTGNDPYLQVAGSDTNVSMDLHSQGTGSILLKTNAGSQTQFQVTHTASAVNYLTATGNVTGGTPDIHATGSDTNINFYLLTKGSGYLSVLTNASVEQLRINHTNSAVNYLSGVGAGTGSGPSLGAGGTDTNVAINWYSRGTGAHTFATNGNGTNYQLQVTHTASAVNYHGFTGSATGGNIYDLATGSDTNIALILISKGNLPVGFYTNGGTLQAQVAHVASAVNYLQFSGSASTASFAQIMAAGSDTNVQISFVAKAAGGFDFLTTTGSTSQFQVTHTASAVNRMSATGSVTGSGAGFVVTGSDTNINTSYGSKGTGSIQFYTNASGGNLQLVVNHVASAVNYTTFVGSATGNAIQWATAGSDSNIDTTIYAKGTGNLRVNTGGGLQAIFNDVPSAVNNLKMKGSATGNAVVYGAEGSDSAIDITMTPKGTGVLGVSYAATTASVAASFSATRIVAIKANGTTYYLAASTATW